MYLRRLYSGSKDAVRGHLLSLDPEARRLRFFSPVGDHAINAYVDNIDWDRAVLFGAYVGGRLLGLSELVMLPDGVSAEAALSVDATCRGKGVGVALLRRAITHARNRGYDSIKLTAMVENRRLHNLVGRYPHQSRAEDGCVDHTIDVMPTTVQTLAEEMIEETVAGFNGLAYDIASAIDTAWAATGIEVDTAALFAPAETMLDALAAARRPR